MPALRKPLENAITGKIEAVKRREVEREIIRFLKGTGTEEEQSREVKSLMALVGNVLLAAESIWMIKRSLLNPCGSMGKWCNWLGLGLRVKLDISWDYFSFKS